jgi:hypothetical protein
VDVRKDACYLSAGLGDLSVNIGFFSALFLIFLALKLAHIIAWSWWWVTAPLWAPFPVVFVLVVIFTLWRETRRK